MRLIDAEPLEQYDGWLDETVVVIPKQEIYDAPTVKNTSVNFKRFSSQITDFRMRQILADIYGEFAREIFFNFIVNDNRTEAINLFSYRPGMVCGLYGKDIKRLKEMIDAVCPDIEVYLYEVGSGA